jgi:hypothetical protein
MVWATGEKKSDKLALVSVDGDDYVASGSGMMRIG